MPTTIKEYVILQLFQKRKYKFTIWAFIIIRITYKKLFESVHNPTNFEGEPGPLARIEWIRITDCVDKFAVTYYFSSFMLSSSQK